jgi:hypothetical protein
MKVLIVLALVSLAAAYPQGLQDILGQTNPLVQQQQQQGLLRRLINNGGIRRGQFLGAGIGQDIPNIYGGIGGGIGQLPKYGPYVRIGNTVVPTGSIYNPQLSQYGGLSPYNLGGIQGLTGLDGINTINGGIGYGPYGTGNNNYNPYNTFGDIDQVNQYGNQIDQISPFGNQYGNQIDQISPFGNQYGNQIDQISPFGNQYGNQIDQINQYGQQIDQVNPLNQYGPYGAGIDQLNQYGDINGLNQYAQQQQGYTPYSKAALFHQLTKEGGLKFDLYAKVLLGGKNGLNRKLKEVCPEVDGGLSYASCLTDAHSKTFQCMKKVEDHPRHKVCVHQPIIKKALRDWFNHDITYHKELTNCLSTNNIADQLLQGRIAGNGISKVDSIEKDLKDEIIDSGDAVDGPVGYDVELGANTKQCFYKLRKTIAKCNQLAVQCPKFRKCYLHPTIKLLGAQKQIYQAKYVQLMDKCLTGESQQQGTGIFGIDQDSTFFPESSIVGY